LEEKWPFYVFEPPLGDLGTTYDDHYDYYLLKISDFAPTGLVNPKFQVDGVARPRLHSMQHGKNEMEISSVQ